jgi:hypothetical protein
MGGGFANATEKNNLSRERRLAVDFRNAEPVVLQKELSSMCFPMANLILMHVHRCEINL